MGVVEVLSPPGVLLVPGAISNAAPCSGTVEGPLLGSACCAPPQAANDKVTVSTDTGKILRKRGYIMHC